MSEQTHEPSRVDTSELPVFAGDEMQEIHDRTALSLVYDALEAAGAGGDHVLIQELEEYLDMFGVELSREVLRAANGS